MITFKIDQGRVKIGKYSLSSLALAEAVAAVVFGVLAIVIGIGAFRDLMTHYAWKSALLLYSSNDIGQAEAKVEKAISYRPEFAAAHELLAKIKVDSGDFEKGRAEYDKLLKISPNSSAAHVGLGVIHLREWDKKKGPEALLNAARAEFLAAGTEPDAVIGLGHVALRRGNVGEAEKAFMDAQVMGSPPSIDGLLDLYLGEGAVFAQRQNYPKASEAYEKAIFVRPNFDRGYANKLYMRAKFMESLVIEKNKFAVWFEQATRTQQQVFALYQANKEARVYFLDALVAYLDAVTSVALRSEQFESASVRLSDLLSYKKTDKRPLLNYTATLADLIAKNADMRPELVRSLSINLEQLAVQLQREYNDLTSREKVICNHYESQRWAPLTENPQIGIEKSTQALEKYNDSGLAEDHLKAMILRTRAICWYNRSVGGGTAKEKADFVGFAVKDGSESLLLEPDIEFSDWVSKLTRGSK